MENDRYHSKLYTEELNFIPFDNLNDTMEVKAKIRYSLQVSDATITPHKNDVLVEFKDPQRAITKGPSDLILSEGPLFNYLFLHYSI